MPHSLHVGVSGVFKKVLDPDGIWIGRLGVWKKILTGHIGSGGEWKLFYGNVPSNVVHLYKDAADVPSGATRLSSYDERFICLTRTSGDIGTTGGAATHTGASHGGASITETSRVYHNLTWNHCTFLCYGYDCHDSYHTHNSDHLMSEVANNNLPEYFDLLGYTHTFFGANALFLFAGSTVPYGWDEYESIGERWPRFNSTAGGTGGSNSHTHSYTGYTSSYTDIIADSSNKRTDYLYDHSHPIWHSHSLEVVPLYHGLKFITRSTPVWDLWDLPSGTVMLLTSSTIPPGWSLYGTVDSDGHLVRGTLGAPGTSSGEEEHHHDFETYYSSAGALVTSHEGNTNYTDTYDIVYTAHYYSHGHYTLSSNMPPWVKLYAMIKD